MNKIDFTSEEIEKVRSIFDRYQIELNELNRLTLENDKLKNELNKVHDRIESISKEETDLLNELRIKYGDFPIQLLKDYLI